MKIAFKGLVRFFTSLVATALVAGPASAQVTVTNDAVVRNLVQRLVGDNVRVLSSSLTCNPGSSGQFTTGTSNLGLTGGIVLSSGAVVTDATTGVVGVSGPQGISATPTNPPDPANSGDPDLDAIVNPRTTQSACALTFTFSPDIDTISELRFSYVFASEEYPEYACTGFNDAFGFFLNGGTAPYAYVNRNLALIPNTNIPVSINSVNLGPGSSGGDTADCTPPGLIGPNAAYYVDNTGGTTLTYDGFTTVLQAQALLQPCSTYTIKMAVANVGDNGFQSAVFLAENSFVIDNAKLGLAGLNASGDSLIEGCMQVNLTAQRDSAVNRRRKICLEYSGTATYGVDYPALPDTIIIAPGATSAFITLAPIQDGIDEPHESVIIHQVNCCTRESIDSFIVFLQDSIEVRFDGRDTGFCGIPQPVPVSISSEPRYTYQWQPAALVQSPTAPSTVVYPPGGSTQFTATVSYLQCPPVQRSLKTLVEPIPIVNILLGGDTTLCLRDSTRFLVDVQPDTFQFFNYVWAPSRYLSSPYEKEPRFFTQDFRNNLYVLSVQTPLLGCRGSDTLKDLRTRTPFDLVNVTPSRNIPYGNSLQLNAENALYYTWFPTESLSNPTAPNPVATPTESTTYTVIGLNYFGCRDTAQVRVGIDYTMSLFIPSAFSPDGDGLNDDFSVRHWSFQKLQEFRVYDRWGREVFATNDITQGWNGRYKGELLPMGVYHYLIRAVRPDGVATMYKGDVTLVR